LVFLTKTDCPDADSNIPCANVMDAGIQNRLCSSIAVFLNLSIYFKIFVSVHFEKEYVQIVSL
jgi:hypothetical protein